MKASRRLLVRQWALVHQLSAHHYGLTIRQLVQRTGTSKKTVYRDLATLRDAGVPLASELVNGEARYRLSAPALPALGLTARQIVALQLARAELEPIAGSGVVAELDGLLEKLGAPAAPQSVHFTAKQAGRPDVVKVVERALESRKRARIEYRAASRNGASSCVHIEPLVLTVADRPYVRAYCVEREAERTYKIDRITRIELTKESATYRPEHPPAETLARAVKVWSGDVTTVKIRLDPEVAWRAEEYPLVSGQTLVHEANGAVVLEARVEGIVEAAHWILGWGGVAEALEPPALRNRVRAELAKALGKYQRPGPAKARASRAPEEKATRRISGRLTQAGTRGA